MKMQHTFFSSLFILMCWKSGIRSPVANPTHVPHYGSMLIIKPMVKYKINNGIITQMSPTNKNCEDSVIKYIWNGSHFRLGPVLSNYAGKYVMRLQNSSKVWENHTFEIIVYNLPSVPSQKAIVDEGDSINLTCTYQSNCDLAGAMWTKDELNPLDPVEKTKIGNNTNVLTYILKNAEKHFAKMPYLCFLSNKQKVTVNLKVKDLQTLGVEKTNRSSWFEENRDALIYFSILGSPLPNLTCVHEKTNNEIISCSKKQMRDILYAAESKPCKSKNERYILSSQSSQTEKVKLLISKVKRERDNGVILCRLLNSKGQKEDFRLAVNVKVSSIHEKSEDKKNLFIAIGCGLLLLLIVVIVFVLYVKERSRSNAYRRFFMANNYTIDPLKTLNEQMHNLSYDQDWEFPYMYLEFNELIGCGAFGKVYKARASGMGLLNPRDKSTHAKKQRRQLKKARGKMKLVHSEEDSCMTVAVKTTKDNPDVNDIRNLAGELKMIIHVGQHENIVNVLGACTKYPKLYMIIEYCSHGSLLQFLRTKRDIFYPNWFKENFASEERFTIGNLVSAAVQICNGMKFLASKKCIHRDLAARNVLVTDNCVMKVADFGMAREVLNTDNYISSTQGYLPIKWMALESILEKVYTEESDVWSFGILLWEMFTLGQTPYPSIPVQQLVELLSDCVRMEKPDHCPDEIYLIMLLCWNQNPKERPSFEVLYGKLQKLCKVNIIEDSGIDMDVSYDGVLRKETDIF